MIRERCSGLWHDVWMTIQDKFAGDEAKARAKARFEVWILSLSYLIFKTWEHLADMTHKCKHAY